jgi:prolipoprotein diacylglyceryltransferase
MLGVLEAVLSMDHGMAFHGAVMTVCVHMSTGEACLRG